MASSLRRPNFDRPREGGGAAAAASAGVAAPAAASLAAFTRQSHSRLVHRDAALSDDEPETDTGGGGAGGANGEIGGAIVITASAGGSGEGGKKKDEPGMDQCVILLEPSLKLFQEGCAKRDKARAKKANGRKKHDDTGDSSGEDVEEDEEDEVPPQLLRLARFFQYRWLPVKKALLRPPPSLHNNAPNDAAPDVELNVQSRLRLAKACWRKGLVAAAEYEALQGAFARGEKRKNAIEEDGENAKRCRGDNFRGDGNLTERVRLALMRLPTEAIQPEHSAAAWRHAKEMVMECCKHWEKNEDEENLHGEGELDALTPEQVANWVLTAWTALLLSRGMDSFAVQSSHHHSHGHNPMASVERHLAALLSDRSTTSNPTLALAEAVASRIDELLSPNNIDSLNGVHLYSMGRLLATFRSREDAEGHIVKSIAQCSEIGGMRGLEQLSKLLAVYLGCIASATANNDATSKGLESKSVAKDMEERLRGRLEKESDKPSVQRANSFLDALLCATAHLINSAE
ncbi:hypothetical protein ACHAXT_011200 [Thalassiosira profunda]